MEINPDEMMPVPIEDLVNGVKTPCDLYVRLNNAKFVLVANEGNVTQVQQLMSFQAKAVTYLWVYKKEYYKMVHQTTSLAGVLLQRNDIDTGKKTQVLSRAAITVFRQVENLGMNMTTYSTARQVSEAVVSLSENHSGLTALIESLKQTSDPLLSHSLAVSLMATVVGQECGYEKKATLEKLSLAGLLHDIGLKSLPQELSTKPVIEMTTDEILKWETHSYRGMQMLQGLGIVPDDIVSMVYEHHENSIGQGFPQQIRDVKLHPLSKIIALCDQFANLTLPGPNTPAARSARDAIMYIEMTMGQPFNKDAFKALRRVVEADKTAAA